MPREEEEKNDSGGEAGGRMAINSERKRLGI